MTKIDNSSVNGASGTSENGGPLVPARRTAVATPTQAKPGAALAELKDVTTKRAGASFRTSTTPEVPQHPSHNPLAVAQQLVGGVLQQVERDVEKFASVANKAAEVIQEASRKV